MCTHAPCSVGLNLTCMQGGFDSAHDCGDGDYQEFTEFYKQTLDIDDSEKSTHNELNLGRPDFPRVLHENIDKFQYFSVDKFNKTFQNSPEQLSTISINVRGISCNYDNLIMYLSSFKFTFDAVILTECHIAINDHCNFDLHNQHPLEGYDKFYVKSTIKYGGVIMYVKSELKAAYCHELTKTCYTHDSVYVKIDPGNIHNSRSKSRKPLYLGGYYRHCNASDVMKFIDVFNTDLFTKCLIKNDVIIAGDFNICLMRSTFNNDSLCFLNTILSNTYEILIFKPTRIQFHKNSLQVKSATIIDQIITNLFAYECTSGNISYPDSDHYATFAIFNTYREDSNNTDKVDLYRRDLHKVDKSSLIDDFDAKDWDTLVYNEDNLDCATENLNECLQELCDKHAPLNKLSNRRKKYYNKPWIDFNMLTEIQDKNKTHGVKGRMPTETNVNTFNVKRNSCTSKLRSKKKEYFKQYFNKFRNNSKKLWDGINLALEQTRRKKALPTIVKDVDGKPIEGDQKIANVFANYFKSVPAKTKSKIQPFKHPYLHYLHKCKPVDNYLVLTDTNVNEVFKHIMKLKNNSSPGPSQVPNGFLKFLVYPLSRVLMCLINRSMCIGYVPKCLKTGKQTPVHKGGEIIVTNYRPITVCSSIAKVLEKIVRDRVMEYLNRVKILNKCQFGFRSKHSTNHAIINLTESTLDALENGLKVGGVFLDIAKAFDTVNHNILLRKLEYYGFRDTTLMWFESYLKNRLQFVNVRQHKSDMYSLEWGIPQGGILAPVLFILFMNDIVHSSKIFDFSMYADDTCLILGIERSIYDETMKTELDNVVDWFNSNELLLNINKTDYLLFGPHHNKVYIKGEHDLSELHEVVPAYMFLVDGLDAGDPDHIEVNKRGEFVLQELTKVCPEYMFKEWVSMPDGSEIFEPDNVKYLGVYFDSKLTFKKQVDIVNCKINRMVGILWKSEHLTFETKRTVYLSMVESHLNYGILTWGSTFARNITGSLDIDHIPINLQQLLYTQNKVIRAIFRKPKYDKLHKTYTSMSPLYKVLKVLKLNDLYYFNLGTMAHNFFHDHDLPDKLVEKFTKKIDVTEVRTRGNEYELYYKTPRLVSTLREPNIASAAFWNTLPNDLRSIDSTSSFKRKLKEYLINKY